jgi:hypothetical protein
MVFNATFNNISVILVEETVGPDLLQVTDKLYHIMFEILTTSVVIGTDCICSCKSNYPTITATTTPLLRY